MIVAVIFSNHGITCQCACIVLCFPILRRFNLQSGVIWFFAAHCVNFFFFSIFENIGSHAACTVSRLRTWNIIGRHRGSKFQPSPLKHLTKGTEEVSLFCQRAYKRVSVNAAGAAGHPLESEPEPYDSKSNWNSPKDALDAFYRFSRPHTVIGTVSSY